MIGYLVFVAVLGWLAAIIEHKLLTLEREARRDDGDASRAAIRELRTQLFTRDIRRAHREQPGSVLVPQDGWIAYGTETRH